MDTFRRLNDPERYYGLSWRGWLAAGPAGGLLYGAVRISPFGLRPTITIVALLLALAGTVLYGLSGQAIGPGRYALALIRYRTSAKTFKPPVGATEPGLVLANVPPVEDGADGDPELAVTGESG